MLSSEKVSGFDEKEGLAFDLESEHAAVFTPALDINPQEPVFRGQNERKKMRRFALPFC